VKTSMSLFTIKPETGTRDAKSLCELLGDKFGIIGVLSSIMTRIVLKTPKGTMELPIR
jgi:hypothetical protein